MYICSLNRYDGQYIGWQSAVNGQLVYWLTISQYRDRKSANYQSIFGRPISIAYLLCVGGILVNCQWYVSQVLADCQSCQVLVKYWPSVLISKQLIPMAFF